MVDRRATGLIRKLRLREISLVDEGDNPHADVLIIKSRRGAAAAIDALREDAEQGGLNMDETDLEKRLGEIESEMEKLEKRATDAEEAVKVEKKRADDAEAKVSDLETEIAKSKDGTVDAEEDIFKGISPKLRERFEAIEKRANDAEAKVAAADEARETEIAKAKAKEFGIGDADKLGGLLVRIAKGKTTADDVALVEDVLKSAKAVADKGETLFKRVGGGAANDSDEEAVLKSKAQEIQKAKPKLTYEAAYAEALDANPELYNAMIEKKRASR